MKKIVIACAVILAGVLSSCGDTNYCYKLTATISGYGVTTTEETYVWGTSNDLDAAIAEFDAQMEAVGISKEFYSIKYQRTNKSESDCD
jgi:hypothetical protein